VSAPATQSSIPSRDRRDRFLGCLLGLAAGDAVGAAAEFKPRGTFPPVDDMAGGGPFSLRPGEWTDDTSMALCLAESIVETGGFDPADQARRYLRWYREGHLSSTGACFDIGGTTREALRRFEATGEPFSGLTGERSAGNGSIMRLAPVPLRWAHDPETAIRLAGESSRTTHALRVCVDGCRLMAAVIAGALRGEGKETLLSAGYAPIGGLWDREPLHPEIDGIARGSYRHKDAGAIRGSGYVARSLEAALWAFHRTGSFAEGCLVAVNLGEDADTTAAVYGQIAGAFYGASGIPPRWLELLAKRELIEGLALSLLALADGGG
jgi:ADP-ribosylglycohydrolase